MKGPFLSIYIYLEGGRQLEMNPSCSAKSYFKQTQVRAAPLL